MKMGNKFNDINNHINSLVYYPEILLLAIFLRIYLFYNNSYWFIPVMLF